MEELVQTVPAEVAWKIAGWAVTAAITLGTMLYKGVWKRINQNTDDIADVRSDVDRLIGSCDARHHLSDQWDGLERRNAVRRQSDEC